MQKGTSSRRWILDEHRWRSHPLQRRRDFRRYPGLCKKRDCHRASRTYTGIRFTDLGKALSEISPRPSKQSLRPRFRSNSISKWGSRYLWFTRRHSFAIFSTACLHSAAAWSYDLTAIWQLTRPLVFLEALVLAYISAGRMLFTFPGNLVVN